MGISNEGGIVGFPRNQLDEKQLTVNQIASTRCYPNPEIENMIFDDPSNPKNCIWIIRVKSVERKPCLTGDKVYIRSGSSSRPANSEEIRRLVLRSSK